MPPNVSTFVRLDAVFQKLSELIFTKGDFYFCENIRIVRATVVLVLLFQTAERNIYRVFQKVSHYQIIKNCVKS